MSYKLVANNQNLVIRVEDGAWIPNDPANKDWVDYQSWLATGNKVAPADPIVVTPSKFNQLIDKLVAENTLTPADAASLKNGAGS